MKKEELLIIVGGAGITSAMLSSIVKLGDIILELGRSLGTALRRVHKGKLC